MGCTQSYTLLGDLDSRTRACECILRGRMSRKDTLLGVTVGAQTFTACYCKTKTRTHCTHCFLAMTAPFNMLAAVCVTTLARKIIPALVTDPPLAQYGTG